MAASTFNNRFWTAWSFIVLGLIALAASLVILGIRVVALERWTTVQGEVTNAVVSGPDEDGNFSAAVTVRWKLNGVESTKRFDNWGNGTGRTSYDAVVARHPKGSTTPILCDPSKPASAFLDAGYTFDFFFAPVLAVLCSLGFVVAGYFIKP